jgi:hypothetical protein
MKSSYLALFSSLLLLSALALPSIVPSATSELTAKEYSVDPLNLEISSIAATKNIVGLGRRLSLGINVTNYGVAAETFNATFYANSTIIQEISNVTVEGISSTIVVFKWTIVGFAYGNYSISASITPVVNETDISDNFINGLWIFVTITGDVNADKWVDIYDAIACGFHMYPVRAFTYPWEDSRQATKNFNDDGAVDIYDIILMAGYFGKHWE